jgi:hypothetical protein
LEELVSGLLRPKLFPFGKLSKAKPAAHCLKINTQAYLQAAKQAGKVFNSAPLECSQLKYHFSFLA